MFKLVLCTSPRLGSVLLRMLLWCRWSHSAILDEQAGWVYHATGGKGVQRQALGAFLGRHPVYEMRPIEVPQAKCRAAVLWLHDQVGKRYDWTAILSFGLARWSRWRYRSWQDDDAWFCSELTETFRTHFERRRFRADLARITPAHQDALAD